MGIKLIGNLLIMGGLATLVSPSISGCYNCYEKPSQSIEQRVSEVQVSQVQVPHNAENYTLEEFEKHMMQRYPETMKFNDGQWEELYKIYSIPKETYDKEIKEQRDIENSINSLTDEEKKEYAKKYTWLNFNNLSYEDKVFLSLLELSKFLKKSGPLH